MSELKEILYKYLPEQALDPITDLILTNNVQINITRTRKTKLGDYRPPQRQFTYHRISVNYSLNKYDFLITLLHEIAHLYTWNKHKNKVEPHGVEWYENYLKLLHQFNSPEIFPIEISRIFEKLNRTPQIAKTDLARELRKYDNNQNYLLVEEIPFNKNFNTPDGRTFIKIEKLKKRYKCICLNDKRNYLFSPIAKVVISQEGD